VTANEYTREVERALRDLPWSQRRDLVADLRNHLTDLPPDTNLVERLGTPERYAADMRAAAGLERRRGPIAWLRARRPRSLVLVVLSLVVLALAIGGLVWIQDYQPLTTGNTWSSPGAIDSPTGDGVYYVFHQGRRFRYGMTIANSGRFTVRVLDIPLVRVAWPVRFRLLVSQPMTPDGGSPPGPWVPFHPFDLHPGEQRGIELSGRFNLPCSRRSDTAGLSEGWDWIPVHYSFLWHMGTAEVPFPEPLSFVYRKNAAAGCPGPKGRRG
jgi:hypothetical protein